MSQIRKCYKDFKFNYQNTLNLSTSNEFLCANYYPQIKSYEIRITSEYNIVNSNADLIKDNTHTWIINQQNYKNKPIKIELDQYKKYVKKEKKKTNILKKLIPLIIFTILLIIYIKQKKDIKND